jgi:hypothetical protein
VWLLGTNALLSHRFKAGRPMRGKYDKGNVGRTPNSAAEPVQAEPDPEDAPLVKK